MPLHIAPILRAREDALQNAGLLIKLDSQQVTIQKNLETSGAVGRQVPKVAYLFENTSYSPVGIPAGS